MVFFLYNLYIFVCIQHSCLASTVLSLGPSNSVIKRLWCLFLIFLVLQSNRALTPVVVNLCGLMTIVVLHPFQNYLSHIETKGDNECSVQVSSVQS